MAVTYGFFNSVNGDRKYNADTMSEFYTGICSPGVFQSVDNGLAVSAGTGLNVSVATGRAIVQGHWLKNDAALTLAISAASTTYARIDAVVIRFNSNNRNITIAVKDGTPAASPSAPSMTRAGGVYEMALAYVNVAANATSVTVTDKRSDTSVCGWAAVAQAIDGTYEAMIDDMKTGFDGVVYQSPGDAVRSCDQKLQDQITSDDSGICDMVTPFLGKMIYQVGNLDTGTGSISEVSGTRLASQFVYLYAGTTVTSNLFQFIPLQYNNGKTYIGLVGSWTTSASIATDGYYRFTCRLNGNPNGSVVGKEYKAQKDIVVTPVLTNLDYHNLEKLVTLGLKQYLIAVDPSNYSTYLPNADNAAKNMTYRITGFTNGTTSIPSGLPSTKWRVRWENAILICFANQANDYARVQLFVAKNQAYYRNYVGGAWTSWTVIGEQNIIVVDKNGNGDYTSFSEAIFAAFTVPNTTVYVNKGEYDIFDEYEAIKGVGWFDNTTPSYSDLSTYGLPFGNGMHIIGSPGSVIKFDGSNTTNADFHHYFSVIFSRYVNNKAFKKSSIEGLTFDVKKCKYCIHFDEGAIENDYTLEVKNCTLKIDNSENTQHLMSDAVGMGASINTTYLIENNYIVPIFSVNARDNEALYWHNTNAASPNAKVIIKDNYIDGLGTIRIDEYGSSTNDCLAMVMGNSCGSAIISNPTGTHNVKYAIWNNEIR